MSGMKILGSKIKIYKNKYNYQFFYSKYEGTKIIITVISLFFFTITFTRDAKI